MRQACHLLAIDGIQQPLRRDSTHPRRPARCQVDADLAALEPRLAQVEAAEAAAPKAPLRLVGALEERMEGLAAQQVSAQGRAAGVVRMGAACGVGGWLVILAT
jgi:hypothetical protein